MSSDISRTSDDQRYAYGGVVMQQGRVILDRDINALQQTVNARTEADALDFVGPCGFPDGPDDGFAIGGPSDPQTPPLWIPPEPLDLARVAAAAKSPDFLISPGTMYVGGQRATFPPGGPAFTYSYFDQPDWIHPDPSAANRDLRNEFIYLHLFEKEVGAVEDPDLTDVALGGPDTTQRIRVVRRVKRMPVKAIDCAGAQAEAREGWRASGLLFDADTMRLLPRAALQVSFSPAKTKVDACDAVAQGGYLGAENQLIRVQLRAANLEKETGSMILWGYDNASFIYRVGIVATDADADAGTTTLKLVQSPVDAFHIPQRGQLVEVLRCGAILGSELDETDPSSPKPGAVRCIAEAAGELFTLAKTYTPKEGTVVLDGTLSPDPDGTQLFLRIWNARLPLDPTSTAPIDLTDADGNTIGIAVTISFPSDNPASDASDASASASVPPAVPDGAYWMIAVRPSTPQAVYPERFLAEPQLPDGPREWACALAVIDWSDGFRLAADCRQPFDNLVELTKRKTGSGGCCTVTVGPRDLTGAKTLQSILNGLANKQPFTVCLLPGDYVLTAPLQLNGSHGGLILEACQGGVAFIPDAGSIGAFVDGVIVATGVDQVQLRGIAIEMPAVPFFKSRGLLAGLNADQFEFMDLHLLQSSIGIRLIGCNVFSIRDCTFSFSSFDSEQAAARFSAGIFIGGKCDQLHIEGNRFTGSPSGLRPAQGQVVQALGIAVSSAILVKPGQASLEGAGSLAPAIVTGSTIRCNRFELLSAAVLAIANRLEFRVEDNQVGRCANGFVFITQNSIARIDTFPEPLKTLNLPLAPAWAIRFDALLYAAGALAQVFPWPAGIEGRGDVGAGQAPAQWPQNPQLFVDEISKLYPPADGIMLNITRVATFNATFRATGPGSQLFRLNEFINSFIARAIPFLAKIVPVVLAIQCSGNDVQALPDSSTSATAGVALAVVGDVHFPTEADGAASAATRAATTVQMTGNRLRTASPGNANLPAALIAAVGAATINGNIIQNDPNPSDLGAASLAVLVTNVNQVAAISGNVLIGRTVLPSHGAIGWEPLNAITP